MIGSCAVDVPDGHWYVDWDNTFGEGFDWESVPGIV